MSLDKIPDQTNRNGQSEAERLAAAYQVFYQPLLLLALLFGSAYTSYEGMLTMAEWISGASDSTRMLCILIVACATGSQFALWHYTMKLMPLFVAPRAKGIGLFVATVLMVALALSSTLTSIIGTTKDSARGKELQAQADLYAAKAAMLAPRAAAMEDALLIIGAQASAACARHQEELQTGSITGSRGKGLVTGYLLGQCESKRAIAETLEETIAVNEARTREIAALSAKLDTIIYDRDRPIGEREMDFLALARRMDALLQALQNEDRTRALRAGATGLSSAIGKLESTNGGFAANQNRAIAMLAGEEAENARKIESLITQIEALPLPEAGRAVLKPAQDLVWAYASSHLPQMAIALIIDLFAPLSTLLFWASTMKRRGRTTENSEGDRS